jgi:hypothetical protein
LSAYDHDREDQGTSPLPPTAAGEDSPLRHTRKNAGGAGAPTGDELDELDAIEDFADDPLPVTGGTTTKPAPGGSAVPPFAFAGGAAAVPAPKGSVFVLPKKTAAETDFPDDLDGLDDDDDDDGAQTAAPSSKPSQPSKMQTFTSANASAAALSRTASPAVGTISSPNSKPGSRPASRPSSRPPSRPSSRAGGGTPKRPAHLTTSSASLGPDEAMQLELESAELLSPSSGSASASVSMSAAGTHSERISAYSAQLAKKAAAAHNGAGGANDGDDFPSDLDDLSDADFSDEDRTLTAADAAAFAAAGGGELGAMVPPSASLGKAARELNEFDCGPAFKAGLVAAQEAHCAAFGGALGLLVADSATYVRARNLLAGDSLPAQLRAEFAALRHTNNDDLARLLPAAAAATKLSLSSSATSGATNERIRFTTGPVTAGKRPPSTGPK